jgi:hypothetical protein
MWLPAKAQSPPRDAASCLCAGIALERRVDLIGTALYLTLSRRQSYSEASQSTRTRHSQWFIGTSRPLHVPDVSGVVTSRFPSASQMPFAAERHHHGKATAHHPGRAACCRVDLMPVRVEAQSDVRGNHSVVVRREKTGRTSSARHRPVTAIATTIATTWCMRRLACMKLVTSGLPNLDPASPRILRGRGDLVVTGRKSGAKRGSAVQIISHVAHRMICTATHMTCYNSLPPRSQPRARSP